ncbi:MAG TPA: zinc ribbon domain-containing protein [Solirubrobacterales bacterium]|nr:zinc ribbon domain-containing protein [Solirubrobacterales bacterium]
MSRVRNPIAGSGDNCPNCGASLAPDQRYCLACGHRRGDPRLPFMDAVVFMESAKQPAPAQATVTTAPPAPDRRPFMSANASLVAGVATLILAIGVGVLIGRSGDSGSGNAAAPAPQVITVGEGSGAATAATNKASGTKEASSGKSATAGKAKPAAKKKAKKKLETGSSGTTKAVEEVYEPAPGMKIAPPEQKLGGECEPGVAGCSKNGKFEGTFFE